jgi:hypothetical protein
MKRISLICVAFIACLLFIIISAQSAYGETIKIFTNPKVSQYVFAAEEIISALESRGVKAVIADIRNLSSDLSERLIVLTDIRDINTTNLYMEEVGEDFGHLGKQAFAIRTMMPMKSYWIFGGDVSGAKYGGLKLAEYILSDGADIIIDEEQIP